MAKAKAKKRATPTKKRARTTLGEIGAPQEERLDVAAYARRITLDVPELLATAKKIAARVPAGPPVLRAHAAAIADNQVVLAAAWRRVDHGDGDTVRPFDLAVDRAWSALHGRLVGWEPSMIPARRAPLASCK